MAARSSSRPRSGHRRSFLILSDDPPPLSPRGQGTLTQLLRNRSQSSLHHYGSTWRHSSVSASDDEESALLSPFLTNDPGPDGAGERRHAPSDERRMSEVLHSAQMRSMRLIGNSNPRYRWERYWKTDEQLQQFKKPLREYYERTNYLIQQYLYIDRLLDSSVPHDLVNEYNDMPPSSFRGVEVPDTISEEPASVWGPSLSNSPTVGPGDGIMGLTSGAGSSSTSLADKAAAADGEAVGHDGRPQSSSTAKKVKRTPKDIYRATETTPLFKFDEDEEDYAGPKPDIPWLEEDDDLDSSSQVVMVAIYVNFTANLILLLGKIAVVASVSSMSVLASLVDAILDFLSTAIVWTTTWLIGRQDQYRYPVGRRKLEPLGILVFSVIMVTAFAQVGLQSIQKLLGPDREVIALDMPSLCIMIGTVLIKGACWLWCRLVKNSSVQALASDALTDIIFNTGSILFPIVGFYANIWWLDALGGLILSAVVIYQWSQTTLEHIKNLSGFSATADQRNTLLYLTMRFAKTIKQIQGLQAYHAGDKLNVEVDIVLDASTTLRDVHDVSESLCYVLESVPIVDRAFVHADYATYNLPTHMRRH
ncbi:ferrous-iron efflux pump FieF [Microdochium nivale]|nr:ferrous-iron efflux pump FieF [Microdochium nivale]